MSNVQNPASLQSRTDSQGQRTSQRSKFWLIANRSSRTQLQPNECVHPLHRQIFSSCWQSSGRYEQVRKFEYTKARNTYHTDRGEVPWAIFSPIAHRIEDRATCRVQCSGHVRITVKRNLGSSRTSLVVTVIILCTNSFDFLGITSSKSDSYSNNRHPTLHRSAHRSPQNRENQNGHHRCTFRHLNRYQTSVLDCEFHL